jgi:hypothetical protein
MVGRVRANARRDLSWRKLTYGSRFGAGCVMFFIFHTLVDRASPARSWAPAATIPARRRLPRLKPEPRGNRC